MNDCLYPQAATTAPSTKPASLSRIELLNLALQAYGETRPTVEIAKPVKTEREKDTDKSLPRFV
ncbi:MAG: hypothetical protein ACO1SV_00215 [Fimbriimonas sp.]